jgi:hypothetical protein
MPDSFPSDRVADPARKLGIAIGFELHCPLQFHALAPLRAIFVRRPSPEQPSWLASISLAFVLRQTKAGAVKQVSFASQIRSSFNALEMGHSRRAASTACSNRFPSGSVVRAFTFK